MAAPCSNAAADHMSKSRPFSIYLLKQGYDSSNSLKDAHKLNNSFEADNLPPNASLFILDGPPTDIWWLSYFGVHATIQQANKGAIVFVPVDNNQRWFALSFGHVYQNLRDDSFEHDFGLRVTLNCVDPKKLRSTDTLQPGAARRQRTQSPIGEDLTYFDFDCNSSVLRSLTGKVSDQYQNLFKDATGASSLSIKSDCSSGKLQQLCEKLFALYQSEQYRATFPDIQNIIPVADPDEIAQLNGTLVDAVRTKADGLYLTIPDIIDYRRDTYYASFSGAGKSKLYSDVFLEKYYEYLEVNGRKYEEIELEDLRSQSLHLVDEDENSKDKFSVLNCLIFETTLGKHAQTYHLAEGKWYRVENKYLAKLSEALDPLCVDLPLPAFIQNDEGEYNKAVAATTSGYICLDQTNISPVGQSQVEPCDLFTVQGETAVFYHIKRSTHSSQLSHLFNQGMNAVELLKVEPESKAKLVELLRGRTVEGIGDLYCESINSQKYEITFGIVTHKSHDAKSLNLPLFSRISLMRSARWFAVAGVRCTYGFISDQSAKKEGIPKKRKKKLIPAESEEDLAVSAQTAS